MKIAKITKKIIQRPSKSTIADIDYFKKQNYVIVLVRTYIPNNKQLQQMFTY